MELTDLVANIEGAKVAIAGSVGLVAGIAVGVFDRNGNSEKSPMSKPYKITGAMVSGLGIKSVPDPNLNENLWVDVGETTAYSLATIIGYEVGYRTAQRVLYRRS